MITYFNNRTLINTGILIRACKFGKIININARFITRAVALSLTRTTIREASTESTTPVDSPQRLHRNLKPPRVPCPFQPKVSPAESGHGLTLHVRSHQCAVRIVVFQKWNQRRCDRNNLSWAKHP